MTHLTSILKKIRKLDKPFYITTPRGISTLVENMEDVNLSSSLMLKDVLLVSDFKCNMISIHKLTYDLNCYVIYDQNSCAIQDQASKRKIVSGELHEGVYVFTKQHQQGFMGAAKGDMATL